MRFANPRLLHAAGLCCLLAAVACGDDGGSDGVGTLPGGTKDTAAPGEDVLAEDAAGDGGPDTTTPDAAADAGSEPDVPVIEDVPAGLEDAPLTADTAAPVDVVEPPKKCDSHADCPGLQLCDQTCVEPPICLGDVDCVGNRTCTRGRCAASPIGCGKDADCAGGMCKVDVGKCVDLYPCANDGGCAGGRRCVGGQCVECTTTADCPEQAIGCASNACQGPASCQVDGDCLSGLSCLGQTCGAPSAAPDTFEPNDTAESASVIIAGEFQQLTIDQVDDDWYRVEVPADFALLVRLDFDDSWGQLDAELRHWPDGAVVGKDERDAPFAVVGVGKQAVKSAFLLHIRHVAGVVSSYQLRIWLSPKNLCINDSFDSPGSNDTKATASLLSGNTFESGGLAICPGDEDWFKLKKSTSFDLLVAASWPIGPGELELALVSEDPAVEPKIAAGSGGQGILDLKGVKSGDWYVRVRGDSGAFSTSYTIKIDAKDTGFCDPDPYEPNDVFSKAKPLKEGLQDDLTLCTGDVDWFRVELPPGKQARVTIAWSVASGVLGLSALTDDADPTVIDEVALPEVNGGVAAHELVAHDPEGLPSILFRVDRIAATDPFPITPYILTMELQDIPCEEEESEDNDTPADAVALAADEGAIVGALCQPDPADWYGVHLAPGDLLDVKLSYSGKKGKLVLNLYDPKGLTLLAKGDAVGKVGTALHLKVPKWWKEGDYLLLITGTKDISYTLMVGAPDVPDCEGDDPLEPNDTPMDAAPGTLGDTYDLLVCESDPDVLSYELVAGASYQLTLKAQSLEPSYKVKVLDPAGAVVLSEVISEPVKGVFLPATKIKETGTWYVVMEASTPQGCSLKVSKL